MTNLKSIAAEWWPDALMVAGAASISYGSGMIYPPAAWIVGGVFVILIGILGGRK